MTTIKEYKSRLEQGKDHLEIESDNKIHVLYLGAKFNARSYYRILSPALELNKTKSHKAIVSTISNNDFNRQYDMDNLKAEEYLIRWADYIIIPTVMQNINYLIKAIRSIHPKVKIVMDIDRNYLKNTNDLALQKKIKMADLEHLSANLLIVDFITTASIRLKNEIADYLATQLPIELPIINCIPNLLSQFGYEEVESIQKNENHKVRIGLIKPSPIELRFLYQIASNLTPEIKGLIQFVCLGKSMFTVEEEELLNKLNIEFHNAVGFADYFNKLNGLKLNISLLITQNPRLNREQVANLYLEVSSFGIPSIMFSYTAKNNQVIDNQTGIIADSLSQWTTQLTDLVTDENKRVRIGNTAFIEMWKKKSFNTKNIEQITKVFL